MKFESTTFGSIVIDGEKYGDVYLLKNGSIIQNRDKSHSPKIKGHTSLSQWELEKLLESNPDYLIIGTGQLGILPMSKETKEWLNTEIKERSLKLIKDRTPKVLEQINSLLENGEKIVGIFHTTC